MSPIFEPSANFTRESVTEEPVGAFVPVQLIEVAPPSETEVPAVGLVNLIETGSCVAGCVWVCVPTEIETVPALETSSTDEQSGGNVVQKPVVDPGQGWG
jgi:hypothetical protein